jgi:enoyl-CoA hydratase/carnithine racemase
MAKVTLHTDGDVGVLSLTNPPLNLWDKGLLADWKSAVDQAARTPMRALVVRRAMPPSAPSLCPLSGRSRNIQLR